MKASKTTKAVMFIQALCKEIVSPLPECFMGVVTMSGWGPPPLPTIVKGKPVDEVIIKVTGT